MGLKIFLVVIILIFFGIIALVLLYRPEQKAKLVQPISPTPIATFPYKIPIIPVKRAYITFLVGDSMMGSLGGSANQLRLDLIELYPNHEFVNYNYGFGSTNILTVPDRLHNQTTYLGQNYPPILAEQFDLIIFDSFAYNPLSQFPPEEGLKKQTEILDQVIKETIQKHPQSVVAILVPIAPSPTHFAQGVLTLSATQRQQWVQERVLYIKNAISYAQKNNLPLINVYEKSLTSKGEANLDYINPSDYIHPSTVGVKLISKTIAQFIYQNKIFPE